MIRTGEGAVLEALNGIRGFAILLVLLSHSSAMDIVLTKKLVFTGAGRYGVFLFFVLSSFLLTRQFLGVEKSVAFSTWYLKRYLLRRFLRIYPLFILSMTLYGILYSKGYLIIPITAETFLKSLLLLDAEGIFWTIPVEFQYYLLLPLISFLLVRLSGSPWLVALGLLVCWGWGLFMPPEYTTNILPFFPVFFIGSLAAYSYLRFLKNICCLSFVGKLINLLALVALLTYIVITPYFYNVFFSAEIGRVHFHNNFILLALMAVALIIMTLMSNGIIRRLMESRFLVFWGKVSFSAYLGHKIVLAFLYELGGISPTFKFILFFALTACCSYISYRFVEKPISKAFYEYRAPAM